MSRRTLAAGDSGRWRFNRLCVYRSSRARAFTTTLGLKSLLARFLERSLQTIKHGLTAGYTVVSDQNNDTGRGDYRSTRYHPESGIRPRTSSATDDGHRRSNRGILLTGIRKKNTTQAAIRPISTLTNRTFEVSFSIRYTHRDDQPTAFEPLVWRTAVWR